MTKRRRPPLPPELRPVVDSFCEKTITLAREAAEKTKGLSKQTFQEVFWTEWTGFFNLFMLGLKDSLSSATLDALYFELSQLGTGVLVGGPEALADSADSTRKPASGTGPCNADPKR